MNSPINNIKINFFRSIQGQLVIWFLLLGLIPLIIIAGIVWFSTQETLQRASEEQLESTIVGRAVYIEHWFEDSKQLAELLLQNPSIRGTEGQNIGLSALNTYRNSPEGREIYDSAYVDARLTIDTLVETYSRLDGAILTDTSGLIYVSTIEEVIEGTNISQHTWLPNLNNISDITATELSQRDGIGHFFIAAPVTSLEGRLLGYIILEMNISTVETLLVNRTGLGETGETYLVSLGTGLALTELRHLENGQFNTTVDSIALQNARSGITSGVESYNDYRNEPTIGAWQTIEGTDWVLIAEQDIVEALAEANQISSLILIVSLVATVLIVVMAYFLARTISRPISDVAATASAVSNGDLSKRTNINSKNEIGILARAFDQMTENIQQLFKTERESKEYLENIVTEYSQFIEEVANGNLTIQLDLEQKVNDQELHRLGANLNMMVKNLSEMALQIDETAASVSAAAAEILASTTQQIASTTEQEAAVTQTMTTVEEVKATVRQTSERAQNVAEASRQSVQISLTGQNSVVDSINGMKLIREKVEGIAENILMLSERTQQIGEIIETVNEIAAQSKLLALNASIEAARAGEDGKGFAVVAMEVRQLAEQSREATARVRDILNQIQQATNTAVMVTEEGSKGAESGMSLVERAGESIEMLSQTIEEASQAAIQIAASTNQQNNGMEQLAQAMASIKQASTQTAASTRQAERSAKDLNDMAHRMQEAVRRYQLR